MSLAVRERPGERVAVASRESGRSRARSRDGRDEADSRARRGGPCGALRADAARRVHQILEQHRHQREGQHQAREQRDDHRKRQRREQVFGRALQQEDRHEDDADAQRRENVGTPTSPAPSMIAARSGSPRPTWRSMFSITTVPLSTRMPTASAKPPSVIVLSVWPPAYMSEHGGDDRQRDRRQNDQRQPPVAEEQQDHQRGQAGRHEPPMQHAVERGLDEDRLIEDRLDRRRPRGSMCGCRAAPSRTPSITASVETPPVLRTDISAPGTPSTATELVCTW